MKVNGSIQPDTLSFEHRFDGIAEMRFRENITNGKDDKGNTIFTYDEYLLVMPDRDGLKTNVQNNQQTWLEYAKNQEISKLTKDANQIRDKLFLETNWTQMEDASISSSDKELMRIYRQNLRDITKQQGFPQNIQWPIKPEVTIIDNQSEDNSTNEINTLGQNLSSLILSNARKNDQLKALGQQVATLTLKGGTT